MVMYFYFCIVSQMIKSIFIEHGNLLLLCKLRNSKETLEFLMHLTVYSKALLELPASFQIW